MKFLAFSALCIAVAAAQYEAPAPPAQDTYPPDAPSYPAPQPYPKPYPGGYPEGPYPGEYDNDKNEFRKLKNLRIQGVTDARKRYFKRRGDDYVSITCPQSSNTSTYTWILADSRQTIPSFGVSGTVALAGGVNVEYIAKLAHHGRWEGRDFFKNDRQRFRRVGCFRGTVASGLTSIN